MSERTYTESELAAERAALLREAAAPQCEWCRQGLVPKVEVDFLQPEVLWHKIYDNWLACPASKTLAIPTDQSALARHDAKLVSPIQAALERDRTKVAECVTAVKNELDSYSWLIDSRGSYEWDDDKWHEEFRRAHEAISNAIEPLVKIAADWTNCPNDWKDVQAARTDSLARVEAAARRQLMQAMHDDLENCLREGKNPVLLLVVWRDVIAALQDRGREAEK